MSLASNEQRSYGAVGGGGWEFEDGAENGGQNIDQLSQTISKKIFQINNQASSLEKTIKKLGTPDDNRQFREKQQAMQQDINQTAEEIPKLLHRLYGGAVERSQKLQAERLKTSFKQALERYDGIQRKFQSRARAASMKQQQPSHEPDTWSEEATMLDQQNRKQVLLQQQQQVEDDLAYNRDREEKTVELETNILDVNTIFKDLAAMVSDQGTMVDTVANNITVAADNVEEGNVQLVQASHYQKSYRKKLLIIVVIFLILAAVLAIVLGVTLSNKKK